MGDENKKGYDNSTYCPTCKEKMYFTRKQRLFFHWVHIVDRTKDMVTQIKCKFCDTIFCRWTGDELGKYDAEATTKQLLTEDKSKSNLMG